MSTPESAARDRLTIARALALHIRDVHDCCGSSYDLPEPWDAESTFEMAKSMGLLDDVLRECEMLVQADREAAAERTQELRDERRELAALALRCKGRA